MSSYRALLGMICVAAAACGAAGGSSGASVPVLTLQPDMRIGSLDGGADAFGRIDALEADTSGRLLVADGHAAEVRVFAPGGAHERTIGRKGSGPGEFRMIGGLALDSAGNLWVMDPAASRFSVWDTSGNLLRTLRRPFSRVITIPWAGGLSRDGSVFDLTEAHSPDEQQGGPAQAVVRYSMTGNSLVSTDTFRVPAVRNDTYQARTTGGVVMTGNVPFSPEQRWGLAPDGSIWIGSTGVYALTRLSLRGDTLASLHHERSRIALSRAERDSVAIAHRLDPARIPAEKPAFASFFVDDVGRVWVQPYVNGDVTEWDVFSSTGALLATVRAPHTLETRSHAPLVRGGYLFAIVHDELGVATVARFRIPRIPAPPD